MSKKITSPFSNAFLKQIEEVLLAEKARLGKETGLLSGNNDNAFPEYGDGEDDNAREIADFTANKPVEMALENELRDVIKSLKRLREGDYGICKYCDNPIDEKRLLARPTSSSCVSCKKTVSQEA
jgi:DnaK suppressor protein